jgi:hypothetical protein
MAEKKVVETVAKAMADKEDSKLTADKGDKKK